MSYFKSLNVLECTRRKKLLCSLSRKVYSIKMKADVMLMCLFDKPHYLLENTLYGEFIYQQKEQEEEEEADEKRKKKQTILSVGLPSLRLFVWFMGGRFLFFVFVFVFCFFEGV